MAYELCFTKKVEAKSPDFYINECCWSGDLVRDQLLPVVKSKFENIQTGQEDWGWFIWSRRGDLRIGVNIFCDDPKEGKFRIHLTAERKKFWRFRPTTDTVELEEIRDIVCPEIERWAGACTVERIE